MAAGAGAVHEETVKPPAAGVDGPRSPDENSPGPDYLSSGPDRGGDNHYLIRK